MNDYIQFVGPNKALEIGGVKFVGISATNGGKLLFSIVFLVVLMFLTRIARVVAQRVLGNRRDRRVGFWTQQGIHLTTALLVIVGLASIWFDDPARLATALGLATAGLAFALQRVIVAVAGYFVILRGKTFNVGDRIRMGGVRGDVVDLGFIQTTIMEMGRPPDESEGDSAPTWVHARQYTGRMVILSNAHIFDEPVYNYTKEFPYIWEELHMWVSYDSDHQRVERILLRAAERHAVPAHELKSGVLDELQRRYGQPNDAAPRVYYRITDNWLELALRFVVRDRSIREVKDAMARQIWADLHEAGIGIASNTYDVVGLPPIRIVGFPPEANADSSAPSQHNGSPAAKTTAPSR